MMTTMMKLNFVGILRRLLCEADLLKLRVLIDENPRIWKIHLRRSHCQSNPARMHERELRSRIGAFAFYKFL
jgi:hypothetical protein